MIDRLNAPTRLPRTGYVNKSDPVLIDRVIQWKRCNRYYEGEGFRVARRAVAL